MTRNLVTKLLQVGLGLAEIYLMFRHRFCPVLLLFRFRLEYFYNMLIILSNIICKFSQKNV